MLFTIETNMNDITLSALVNGKRESITVDVAAIRRDIAKWIKSKAMVKKYFNGVDRDYAKLLDYEILKASKVFARQAAINKAYRQMKSRLPIQKQFVLARKEKELSNILDGKGVSPIPVPLPNVWDNEYNAVGFSIEDVEKAVEETVEEGIDKIKKGVSDFLKSVKAKTAKSAKNLWEKAKKSGKNYTKAQLDKFEKDAKAAWDELTGEEKEQLSAEMAKEALKAEQDKAEWLNKVATDTKKIWDSEKKKLQAKYPHWTEDQLYYALKNGVDKALELYNVVQNPGAITALKIIAKQEYTTPMAIITTTLKKSGLDAEPSPWVYAADTFMANPSMAM